MATTRFETPADIASIYEVNIEAFGQPGEADLVDQLRHQCDACLSLVAEEASRIVAHIMFTPVVIGAEKENKEGMGLAPIAVVPDRQRSGIGSRLIRQGIEVLKERSCPFIIVLGHPEYYPRFGFEPASRHGIGCQWPGVPDEAFMILILNQESMNGVTGVARYNDAFNTAI